ncbi:hypothetical protein QBC36DRAFT_235548 [Triangularia setosa]|uniref:Uncharacterized protein n=1 Tax=Triangularia setosa TaxID=2587417 RepID=A0AAN7A784_9PEZI|nr:hypothetical protein QBC36DRAFT_235548 [Podospora setosa]
MKTVCLDVAIDHRIRRLLRPIDVSSETLDSTHISMLNAYGRQLGRSDDEIRVTSQLAGPQTTGGILVALQQPRSNHPFEKGIKCVIDDCETLAALGEVFHIVSCGTLEIGTNVSVIDLLPYITVEQMNDMDDVQLGDAFLSTVHVFGRKKPQIILCCAKIWLGQKRQDCKGEAWKFESQRLGTSFGKRSTIRFRDETRNWVSTERVNGFHPSYCMNYYPHISCFRQLQILTVAEACGMYRDDWTEETWMKSLRDSCASQVTQLQGTDRGRERIYLPEYERKYSSILEDVQKAIDLLSHSTSLYDDLLQSRLSSMCNDANLIILQMFVLSNKGWPKTFNKQNGAALWTAIDNTRQFLVAVSGPTGHPRLCRILRCFMSSLRRHVTDIKVGGPPWPVHLQNMRECFLSMAQDLETFLGELLESERTMPNSGTELDSLSGLVGNLEI